MGQLMNQGTVINILGNSNGDMLRISLCRLVGIDEDAASLFA